MIEKLLIDQGPELEQITSSDFQTESEVLIDTTSGLVSVSEIPDTNIIDFRETLTSTKEIFQNPIFFDPETSRSLVMVVDFLSDYQFISKAMWSIEIDQEKYIFQFEEKVDQETGIHTSTISHKLQHEKQQELDQFIESENVHKVTLQETNQVIFVESELDLHSKVETLQNSEVKLTGYEIRVRGDVVEAYFAGKWYLLESSIDKNSDIYQLISKITQAIKKGQTAFTVTQEGISSATSKKLEIKEQKSTYIINVFDITTNRVYNYILVDTSLQQVADILSKYGIEINLANPDLTFGTVSGFDKDKFEQENFGSDITFIGNMSDIDKKPADLPEQTIIPNLPFSIDSHPLNTDMQPDTIRIERDNNIRERELDKETATFLENPHSNETIVVPEDKDAPVEPKPPLNDGLIIILETDHSNGRGSKTLEKPTSAFDNLQFAEQNETQKTNWQVYTERYEDQLTVPIDVVNQDGMEIDHHLQQETINQETVPTEFEVVTPDKSVLDNKSYSNNGSEAQISTFGGDVDPTLKVKFDILSTGLESSTQTSGEETSDPIEITDTKQVTKVPFNIEIESQTETFEGDVGVVERVKAGVLSAGLASLIKTSERDSIKTINTKQVRTVPFETAYNANNYLYATAKNSFTWPHTMTESQARLLKKQIEEKIGKTVIELKMVGDKLTAITK